MDRTNAKIQPKRKGSLKYYVIDNFLSTKTAEELSKSYSINYIKQLYTKSLSLVSSDSLKTHISVGEKISNKNTKFWKHQVSDKRNLPGSGLENSSKISWNFFINNEYNSACSCLQCSCYRIIIASIQKILNQQLKTKRIATHLYTSNNFLSQHRCSIGDFEFAYGLTKGWRSQYGGNFFFLDGLYNVLDVITLKFNQLVLYSPDPMMNTMISYIPPSIKFINVMVVGVLKRDNQKSSKSQTKKVIPKTRQTISSKQCNP